MPKIALVYGTRPEGTGQVRVLEVYFNHDYYNLTEVLALLREQGYHGIFLARQSASLEGFPVQIMQGHIEEGEIQTQTCRPTLYLPEMPACRHA